MVDWIEAPAGAKTAAIKIYNADNQLVVLVNGQRYWSSWDSGWTTGDPDFGGRPIEFPLPDQGYVDVAVLGANGGVGGVDPYNFKTQIEIPGRTDLLKVGRSLDNGPPGIQYNHTFRIYRPYQRIGNDGVPLFEPDVNLHQRICPIHSTTGRRRTYLCRVFIADSGAGSRVGFEFRIKETDGIFRSLTVPYLCRKPLKGSDGKYQYRDNADDLPQMEFLDSQVDKYDDPPTPLISGNFINHGSTIGSDGMYAYIAVEYIAGWRVSSGDTLSKIAMESYGDAEKWQKIYKANSGVIGENPEALQVGQILEIPD